MADSIRVTLTPDKMLVQPDGGPIEALITIQNTGATVDQYAVELDQLPGTWYSLSNTSVALFPQDTEDAKLVIHPPKGGGARAGTYPFTVTVLSRADPTQTSRVEGTLQVGAVAAFEMAMTPSKVTGRRGKYTLSLRNGGNADIEVPLEATDSEEGCKYRFSSKTVQLAAGQKASVSLVVRPKRSSIAGAKKNFDFKVQGTPNRGEMKTVTGQLVHKPLFRTWRPVRRFIFAIILIGLIAGVASFLLSSNGKETHWATWKNDVKTFACSHLKVLCDKKGALPPTPSPTPSGQPTPIGTHGPDNPTGVYGFIGAFYDFHHHAPTLVGTALENESTNSRVATQRTTTGLLLFDRKDGHSFLIRADSTVWEYFAGVTQQVR